VPEVEGLLAYGLRCADRQAPLGMDEAAPVLSWRMVSSRRGEVCAAHRVVVHALPTDPTGPAWLAWDSGWQPGDRAQIRYGGSPLHSETRYRWTVRLRDGAGADSPEATSEFETGLGPRAAWGAHWISHDPACEPYAEPPADVEDPADAFVPRWGRASVTYVRRDLDIPAGRRVVRARAHITARGLYRLQVNGARIGSDELTPGWTDYRFRVQYQTYDITAQLHEGANALGVLLNSGWYSGRIGMDALQPGRHYGKRSALLARVSVDLDDGSRIILGTDERWCERGGPICSADLLAGEVWDLRVPIDGWDLPGAPAGTWTPMLRVGSDTSTVVASTDEPVRVTQTLPAVDVRPLAPRRWLVDFGQNVAGRVALHIPPSAERRIVSVRHAEILDGPELYTANLRGAEAIDVVIVPEDAGCDFEPLFTQHGFRYVEIDGLPDAPAIDDVRARVLHSDVAAAGSFTCSDPGVDQLMANVRWGARGNFVSVPTDCPQRDERLGWTADAQVFAPTATYLADTLAFYRRWLRDVVDGQSPEGSYPDVAPLLFFDRDGAPAWGDGGVIVPWVLWEAYGDIEVLRENITAMRRWVDFLHEHNADLIWRHRTGNHYGDWLQVDAVTDREVLATAYFAHSTRIVADALAVLGSPDAHRYAALAADIAAAFGREFLEPDGWVRGHTQTGQLLPLAFDLLPGDARAPVFARLVEDLESRDVSLTTGFCGVSLLCPVLSRFGRPDLAYALLHDDRYPSWGYSVRHGATTIWERWNGWTEKDGFGPVGMNSFNHYSLGSVAQWVYSGIGGIAQSPGSVGFRDLLIAPQIGGRLSGAAAAHDAPHGRIETSWTRTADTLTLDVRVPVGSSATIVVPAVDPAAVREGGRALVGRDDIEVLDHSGGAVHCRVGSGTFSFTS
jgi:alpha-L-rhamnosidase